MKNILAFLRRERIIFILCGLVFLVTLGYAFAHRIQPAVDARAYDTMGWNIAQGLGFRMSPEKPLMQDDAMTYQGPAYQYFLAGIYQVFGHNYWMVWIIQALLRAISAGLLYAVCKQIFGEQDKRIGWFAAGLFGFYPDLVESGAMLMTESLFLFLCSLMLYFFSRLFNQITYRDTILLGLSFGATILTRSTVAIFGPFMALYLLKKRALAQTVLLTSITIAMLVPWTVRNYKIYHEFIPTMANFGYNLIVGNRVGHDGEGGNAGELEEIFTRLGVIGANKYGIEYFKGFVSEHPILYSKLVLSRTVKYFSFIRPIGFWFYQTGWSQFVFIMSSSIWAFAVFSLGFSGLLLALLKEKKPALNYLAWFTLLTCLPVIAILVETRYRLPIYPFMAIFAGFSLSRALSDRKLYQRYLLSGLGITIVLGGIDLALEYQKVMEKIQGMF